MDFAVLRFTDKEGSVYALGEGLFFDTDLDKSNLSPKPKDVALIFLFFLEFNE